MCDNKLINFIEIKVISLSNSFERREKIIDLMKRFSLSYSFFDAYNVRNLNAKKYAQLTEMHQPFSGMTDSEFGCDLSHYYTISDWADDGKTEYLMVLEDDAVFSDEMIELLNSDIQNVINFDVLKIGGDKTKNKRVANILGSTDRTKIVYPFDPSFCAVGYIVSRRNVEAILLHLRQFFVQIDPRLFKYYPYGLTVLEASPFIVSQSGSESTIEHIPEQNKKSLLRRFLNDLGHAKRTIIWLTNHFKHYGLPRNLTKI